MKKIHLFLVLFLSLSFLMIGCEEENQVYTIKIVSSEGGNVTPSGIVEVEEGSNFSVSLVPDAGFVPDSIFVNGVGSPLSSNKYDFLNINSNYKVSITFKRIDVAEKFTIEVTAGEGGTVTPLGITEVVEGFDFSVSILANLGFATDSIIIDGTGSLLISNSYNFLNVTSNHNVRVVFKKTLSWFLMNGKWSRDSIIRKMDGETTWTHAKVWGVPGLLQIETTFLSTGRIAEYWNGAYVGDAPWFLCESTNSPTINIGGQVLTIEKLDESNLVLAMYDMPYVNDSTKRWSTKDVYSHH